MTARKKKEPKNNILETALSLHDIDGRMTTCDSITDLLQSEMMLNTLVETVSQGGSIESVEMSLGITDGLLENWLRLGKTDKTGPFRLLYLFYCRAASGTRLMAETALLAKNPDKWLEKIDVRNRLTKPSESNVVIGTAIQKQPESFLDVESEEVKVDPE